MHKRFGLIFGAVLLGALLAACGKAAPSRQVQTGDVLLRADFQTGADWEAGSYPADAEAPTATLGVVDGRYRIDYRSGSSASFVWGLGGGVYENVVVEVTTEQLSADDDNLYGVGCRMVTDERGEVSGYALLISGDGHYGIADLSRRSLDFILEWHQTDIIHPGRATNTLRAVCVDDYLALYVNDEFLGEVQDSRYRRAGQIALIAGAAKDTEVSVAFDDLTVYEGALK